MYIDVKDSLNIISRLTPARIVNAAKVILSFYYARTVRKPIQWGMPITISFEPTTSCNLRCPECPSGLREFTRPTGMLQTDFFTKTIDELHKKLMYLIFYFQGEPYLNTSFLDMVKYASSKGIYTATSTNAHYLTDENARKTIESGLDRLIISIDGTTQETYSSYRVGGDLEKVIQGTKTILKLKKEMRSTTPSVIFQFLVVKPNEHQIDDVIQLGKDLGVDSVKFKTAQLYEYEDGNELIPDNTQFSRYRKGKDGKWSIKNKLMNHCWKLWHSCVVTWDGLIVPCCFDKDATHQMGDLKQRSFAEIWHNGSFTNFRRAILKSRSEIDICTNCTEGTKVWSES